MGFTYETVSPFYVTQEILDTIPGGPCVCAELEADVVEGGNFFVGSAPNFNLRWSTALVYLMDYFIYNSCVTSQSGFKFMQDKERHINKHTMAIII